jgi:hypothetical protein
MEPGRRICRLIFALIMVSFLELISVESKNRVAGSVGISIIPLLKIINNAGEAIEQDNQHAI